jgi:hypothetical protein
MRQGLNSLDDDPLCPDEVFELDDLLEELENRIVDLGHPGWVHRRIVPLDGSDFLL